MIRITALLLTLWLVGCAASPSPRVLTEKGHWTFRKIQPGGRERWHADLAELIKKTDWPETSCRWPGQWRTFVAWQPTPQLKSLHAVSKQDSVPSTLELGGTSACRAMLPLYTGGVLDFSVGHGSPGAGRWAWAFGQLQAKTNQSVRIEIESPGPVKLWVDGKLLIEADQAGRHSQLLGVTKGNHVVAAQVTSGTDRWYLRGRVLPAGSMPRIQARCRFVVSGTDKFVSLSIKGPFDQSATLNGQQVDPRPNGLISDVRQGISPSLLRRGENILIWTLAGQSAQELAQGDLPDALAVVGVRPAEVRTIMGPVVSVGPNDSLQLAIATNAPVEARLEIDGRTLLSPAGLYHRWTLGDLNPGTEYAYTISPGQGEAATGRLKSLPGPDEPLTVAIVGDPQSGKAWAQVADLLQKQRPDLVIVAGDFVVDGLLQKQWQETFLQPAGGLLASTPFRCVPGNHDRYSPLLEQLFGLDLRQPQWTHRAPGSTLVGIDGGGDFTPRGPAAGWLDQTLKQAADARIFLISHYPAYSSRNHGKLAQDQRVLEWTSRTARNRIVPMLAEHGVAAMFAGHDHGYERSELPDGPTMIVTGGAGAGTYPKRKDAKKQNPYSAEIAVEHHACLLEFTCGKTVLRVVTPDGRTLDEKTWPEDTTKEK